MEVISVNITKGGTGKTTTVQALAEIFGKVYGERVLCIDMDPQCNLTTVSGIDILEYDNKNLRSLLKDELSLTECVAHSKYYDIVPGSLRLVSADLEFSSSFAREQLLSDAINDADYDIVIIDSQPNVSCLQMMGMAASSHIIIPSECSALSMIGLDQLSSAISSMKKHSQRSPSVLGILLTRYNPRTVLSQKILSGMERMAKDMQTKVFESKIRETVKVKEAQSMHLPLLDWDEKATAIVDYMHFVEEIKGDILK